MSRIAWFCIPAWGHTNPTLEVVRALCGAGHQVRYYSFDLFREKIEAVGAQFVSCDAYSAEMKMGPGAGERIGRDTAFAMKVVVETTLALEDGLLADLRGFAPDVVVADSVACWGKLLAQKIGVPFVSSTTTFAFNQHSAKIMKQSFGQIARMVLGMPQINRQIQRLRRKGYPVKSLLDIIANDNDTETIVYTSALFQPCAETFSEKVHFVGTSVCRQAPLPRKTGKKRVYVSLGTVNNNAPEFFRRCIRALGEQYELIVSTGMQVETASLGPIPADAVVAQRVEQMAVLEDCDVFLTHCGMNSASEALCCGVPMVLFPQTAEQDGVARRVEQLGAGVRLQGRKEADVRRAVEAALADASLREAARNVGRSLQNSGGPQEAARAILSAAQA